MSPLSRKPLPPEDEYILRLTALDAHVAAAPSFFDGLSEPRFDWGRFVDNAVRHKVVPLIWHNLCRTDSVTLFAKHAPSVYVEFMRLVASANRVRNEMFASALTEILGVCKRREVPVLVRKGLVLSALAYGDLGARMMSDIDLLIRRADTKAVLGVLGSLGFESGRPSADCTRVLPWSRAASTVIHLTMPNIPSLVRLGGSDVLPAVVVDLTTGLFEKNTGYSYDTEYVFSVADEVSLDGLIIPTLRSEDYMVDVCAHLFKEAKSLGCIQSGKDLVLQKFSDVARLSNYLSREGKWGSTIDVAKKFGADQPLFYSLYFTNEVFQGSIDEAVLSAVEPADKSFLFTFGDHEHQTEEWPSEDVVTRTFDRSRSWSMVGRSRFPD